MMCLTVIFPTIIKLAQLYSGDAYDTATRKNEGHQRRWTSYFFVSTLKEYFSYEFHWFDMYYAHSYQDLFKDRKYKSGLRSWYTDRIYLFYFTNSRKHMTVSFAI